MSTEAKDRRSLWGRSRFGGGTGALLASCVLIALTVSGVVAGYAWAATEGRHRDVLLVFAFIALPTIFAMAWVCLVDSGSIRDAVERPDDTIEGQWLQRAQSGAFTDLLFVLGLVLVIGVFIDADVSAVLALGLAVLFAMADVGVRIAWLKRREG